MDEEKENIDKGDDTDIESDYKDTHAENLVDELKEQEEVSKEIEKKQDGQIRWVVFLMIALIVIIIAVPFINKNFINKFEYKGLDFQKTKLGDLTLYYVNFPVIGTTGQVTGDYSMNFRTDPRKSDLVQVNIPNNRIGFTKRSIGGYNPVYISVNPDMQICEYSSIAMINLAGFLRDSGLEVKSASPNKTHADENKIKYADCEKGMTDTVIRINSGDENKIDNPMKNCYDIEFKDCEILGVSEKFMLLMLEEYAGRFESI
ncbi:MAG: hypothetical protein ABIH37_03600 [archaeon]